MKKCPGCGRFMYRDDSTFGDELHDSELMAEHGIDENTASFSELARFFYVHDMWNCDHCDYHEWDYEGPRYYLNPITGNYDAEKPLTPYEEKQKRLCEERERLEAAGQLRLFEDETE
jgi:hypothetical protein